MRGKRRWHVVPIVLLAMGGMAVLHGGAAFAGKYVDFSKEHPRGEVKPDKALLYVMRPTSMGFAIKSFFLCDEEILGVNRGSSYFFAHVEPGKHVFWSKSENVDAVEMEVEAGKTYYIQQQVQFGGFRARTKLKVLDDVEGEKVLAKSKKYGVITDKGIEKGREIAKKYKENTQEDLDRRARRAEEKRVKDEKKKSRAERKRAKKEKNRVTEEPEAAPAPEPAAQPEIEVEAEVDAETEPAAGPEADSDAGAGLETEAEAEPEDEVEAEPEPEVEVVLDVEER